MNSNPHIDRPLLGIMLMMIAVSAFASMDALVKWLSATYPVPYIVAMRSWFGFPFILLFVYFDGGFASVKTRRPKIHLIRFILVLGLSFGFFWGLSQMKLADAIALSFAAPIFITALSVPLLKEAVGVHRWGAVMVGFIGVLIMVRPGSGLFQWASVVILGAVFCYALLMISTRALKSSESTNALLFYPPLGLTLSGLIIVPLYWTPMPLTDIGLFACAGLLGSIGVVCITHTFRLAPAAVATPFEYTALIWGTLLGYLVWGDLPDSATIVGAIVVVLSGIYILIRETRASRTPGGSTGSVH